MLKLRKRLMLVYLISSILLLYSCSDEDKHTQNMLCIRGHNLFMGIHLYEVKQMYKTDELRKDVENPSSFEKFSIIDEPIIFPDKEIIRTISLLFDDKVLTKVVINYYCSVPFDENFYKKLTEDFECIDYIPHKNQHMCGYDMVYEFKDNTNIASYGVKCLIYSK